MLHLMRPLKALPKAVSPAKTTFLPNEYSKKAMMIKAKPTLMNVR